MPPFSVCMSVYRNDKSDDFKLAVNSVYKQTIQPDEIIIVVDGPVGDNLKLAILDLQKEIPILNVIYLTENMGHAIARQTALDAARNELIAIMDSDDISLPNRFEKQLIAFGNFPDVSVVGGLINEFVGDEANVVGTRWVPENNYEICSYMKDRCPMNLVTVMMRKKHICDVGGYIDWYCEEDYYLWVRLYLKGYKFYNIQDNLVNVRVGKEMYSRRGGMKYFKSEIHLQKFMLDNNIIGYGRYCINIIKRLIVQVLLPNNIRGWVFRTFARK